MNDPVLIRGGTVVDGTGAPARTADVLIADGVVVEMGRVQRALRLRAGIPHEEGRMDGR